MAETASRKATYDDLVAVPEPLVAEIVAGRLYTNPRPASPHGHAASTLGMDIGSAFQRGRGGPGGWWIQLEPELHFDQDVLVPDLAGWRRERMPEVPLVAAFELAPDWVCEVLSPTTQRLDRAAKMPVYARVGVGHVWLLDPLQRTLEVYRREGAHWLLVATHGGEVPVRAEPFEAIELELEALWLPGVGEPKPLWIPDGPAPLPLVG